MRSSWGFEPTIYRLPQSHLTNCATGAAMKVPRVFDVLEVGVHRVDRVALCYVLNPKGAKIDVHDRFSNF